MNADERRGLVQFPFAAGLNWLVCPSASRPSGRILPRVLLTDVVTMKVKFLAASAFAALMFAPAANAATLEEMRATALSKCTAESGGAPEAAAMCECMLTGVDNALSGDDLTRVYTLMVADPQPANDTEAAALVGMDEASFTQWSAGIEPKFGEIAMQCMPQPAPAPETPPASDTPPASGGQ